MASIDDISDDDYKMCCQAPHILPDDDEDSIIQDNDQPKDIVNKGITVSKGAGNNNTTLKDQFRESPILIEFGDENQNLEPDEDPSFTDPTSELLYLHYKLGHLPFEKIKQMSHVGILHKKFLRCRVPKCAACMYGTATKRPWRTKTPTNQINNTMKIKSPGDCVSVDQFESPVPGFIAQLKGKPTIARYNVGTVFVDHASDITYVHFQKSMNAAETIEAKEATMVSIAWRKNKTQSRR
jgi:hypothetical protein